LNVGKIIVEAVTLTTFVVISLSLYTFWTIKKGHDFSFLSTFLTGATLVVILLSIIKVFLLLKPLYLLLDKLIGTFNNIVILFLQGLPPSKTLSTMMYGCFASIIFYGHIIYDTNNLVKKFTYAKYILLCLSLYLDIILTFMYLLFTFSVADLIKKKM
jgi:FtsH-binding integral membrane protein